MVTRYLDTVEIAHRLRRPQNTIALWIRTGKLPAPHVQIGERFRGWLPEVIADPNLWGAPVDTVHYLRRQELTQWIRSQIGEGTPYRIPEPDIQVGDVPGWLPPTQVDPAWLINTADIYPEDALKHRIVYLGAGDISERLGRPRSTINRWITEGKLPPPNARIGTRAQGWLPEVIDNPDSWGATNHVTIRYVSAPELARLIGVKRGTLNHYKLPPEDALIGNIRGYLTETIDAWNARRPGVRPPWSGEDWHLPPEVRAS
ncbi:helix-turn-helix transcriptional regulator [Nocardia farcinica]|uniref:helix-turn-helix transcriptional regulator n=1 Tax=Nocardia farcinica TaxID=37329 RepID=UPI002455737D|nr:hypothetical protein [Nocardia farcinica]